ncbi:MAG TPA: hypothetical protein VIL01_02115 [Thermomicrobiales bacterium]|mgnify:CR=1 FL=1
MSGYPILPGAKEAALETLLLLHDRLATTVLLFMLAVGVWGLFSFMRGESLSGSLAGALVIGQILIVVQVLFGVALLTQGSRAASSVHYLYGATAVLIMPFFWSYMRDRHPRQGLLIYSLIALFIAGLAIRGMTTAH